MRNMSFSMTTEQIRLGAKTVTRRFGWKFLKPGDYVRPVVKAMGLKKGEKVQPIRGALHIIDVRREPLDAICKEPMGTTREGFPEMTGQEFVGMLMRHYRCKPYDTVTRIEFMYTDASPAGEHKAIQP
jgi:hypothetical protein